MSNIKMTHGGTKYVMQTTANKLNKMAGYNLFVRFSDEEIDLDDEDFEKIDRKSYGNLHQVKSTLSATAAQLRYLVNLRVDISGKKISKKLASQLIAAAKSGDGLGSLGFSFTDGSN